MNLNELKNTKVILSLWDLKMIFLQGKSLQEWEENRDELDAMGEEYNIDSPKDFGDYLKEAHDIDIDGSPDDVAQLTINDSPYNVVNSSPENNYPTDTPKGKLVECIMRIVNGEQIKYGEPVDMLSVDGICSYDIIDVIEELDESGKFEGYLDGNGCDQDWSFNMNVKGVGVQMWGSITGANCQLQSM